MPGRLFLTRPIAEIAAEAGAHSNGAEEEARLNIAPGQNVWTVVAGPALRQMRWGLIPVGRTNARGRPVMETIVNARSETVFDKSAFAGVRRCVVPCDGWYEWTGTRGRKTPWRIQRRDGGILWFAAICDLWTAPGGKEIWQVATVTCPPNADVREVHDRMGVLLDKSDVTRWIDDDEEDVRDLLQTPPEGQLEVTQADDVDWSGP